MGGSTKMPKPTRRQTLGTLAGAGLAAPAPGAPPKETAGGGLQFAELFYPGEPRRLTLARQVGVNHAIVSVAGALGKVRREEYAATLLGIRDEFREAGMTIAGVESHPVAAEKIKLGAPGRDEEIENYQ